MSKNPYIPLYTGDWLKDPALTICEPSTRGIWMDLICVMHELDRTGELRGTTDKIARLARCSTEQLKSALTELQITGAALVTERNGIVTLTNRRMKREFDKRLLTKKRVERFRNNNSETQMKREKNGDVIPIDNESENDVVSGNGNQGGIPTVEECRVMAGKLGMPEDQGEAFFHHYNGQGWVTGASVPITNWVSLMHKWKMNWERSSVAKRGENPAPSGLSINSVAQADSLIKEYNAAIASIKDDRRNYVEVERESGPPVKQLSEEAGKLITSYRDKIQAVRNVKLKFGDKS